MGKQKVFVVLNPIAGHSSAEEIRLRLEKHFSTEEWEFEVYETTGEENVVEITREACQRGAKVVIAAGGDGTVAEVVTGLIGTSIPLGILPVGTGNGLARGMQIPLDVDKALQLIAGEHDLQPLDAMQVEDRYFLLNVSAGISAQAMRETPTERKRRFGVLAYAWTILKQLAGYQPRRFHLVIDGQEFYIHATEVLVSNGSILARPLKLLGPREDFNDSQFDVQIIMARSLKDYLKLAGQALLRTQRKQDRLQQIQVREKIRINSTDGPYSVQADGELIGKTPVEVRIVPDAVQVIVPTKSKTE